MSFSISVAPEWDLLSDRYYRRFTLYSALPWSTTAAPAAPSSSSGLGGATIGRFDLSTHIVAAAPFGGPIAAVHDDSKIVQVHSEPSSRHLVLFSSSAHPIASAPWPPLLPRLHSLAFSSSLCLLALLSDGSFIRFRFPDLQPIPSSNPVPLLPPASGGVADALFWGGGVAILTEDNRVVVATDIEVGDPHTRHLADPCVGDEEHVRCMAVVDPQFVKSGSPEVLLAVGNRVISVLEDGIQVLGENLEIGPVQKMALSPNGKLLAAFAHDGRLFVIPTDFSRIRFEYKCDSALPPEQIAWCGLDSVLLYWPEVLLMVGPNGDPVQYNYDEPIRLIPECDGVRILSNSSMEFLHQVPDSTTLIFGIGSMSPAALLYDACDRYDRQRQSAKPYDNYELLSSSLPEAIEACIDAAGHEFDVSQQRALLRAAKYGLAFCSQFLHERLQEMCKMLRVLNAVRNPEIGMPLTIQQYKLLTASVLIGRLVNTNQHLLALRISEYLNLNSEVVILHWACEKITVSTNLPDTVLFESLLDKLRLCKGISYAVVAAHANNSGWQGLAAMLVDHESQFSNQVDGSEGLVKEEKEYSVPEGSKNITPKVMQEITDKFFMCSICQFIVRKPTVISCGHMFCVGCIERAMSIVGSSVCPMCKECYNYLPFVCRLIGDLVFKLQSFAGDAMGTREASEKAIEPIGVYHCSVQLEDVSCIQCQNLLYQPTVLNCGHVFCISCVLGDGERIKCPSCGMLHPIGFLAICCDLNNFIEDYFPVAYKARAEKVQLFSGTSLLRESLSHHTQLSSTHVGVGCDFCGVYPIQGDRFSCKTCVNFDLCEKCAKMDTPIAGRSGQKHSLDHNLELNNSFLFSTVLSVLDENEAEQDVQGSWDWGPAHWQVLGGGDAVASRAPST